MVKEDKEGFLWTLDQPGSTERCGGHFFLRIPCFSHGHKNEKKIISHTEIALNEHVCVGYNITEGGCNYESVQMEPNGPFD